MTGWLVRGRATGGPRCDRPVDRRPARKRDLADWAGIGYFAFLASGAVIGVIIALVEGIKALKYADSVDRREPREGPQPVDFPPVRLAKHELEADDDDH